MDNSSCKTNESEVVTGLAFATCLGGLFFHWRYVSGGCPGLPCITSLDM